MLKIAVLDDYAKVALQSADWSVLQGKAEITVFDQHLSEDEAVSLLQPFRHPLHGPRTDESAAQLVPARGGHLVVGDHEMQHLPAPRVRTGPVEPRADLKRLERLDASPPPPTDCELADSAMRDTYPCGKIPCGRSCPGADLAAFGFVEDGAQSVLVLREIRARKI